MEQLNDKIKLVSKLIKDNNWETMSIDDDIVSQRKYLPGSNIGAFRSYGFVNADVSTICNSIWNIYTHSDLIKQYDLDVIHYEIVSNINKNTRLCYQINQLPMPLWSRDLVYLQTYIVDKDISYILMYSVETNSRPKLPDKYVRAIIDISAYVIIPSNKGCIVHRIGHIDPQGLIPSFIINQYVGKTAKIIKLLKKIYT